MEHDRSLLPLQRALRIYQARRSRRALFAPDSDIFGEPAWDILLDLFIAHERRQPICLSDASLGAGVPLSTAQRWVKQLLERGLLVRRRDDGDRRISNLSITEAGSRTVHELVGRVVDVWNDILRDFDRDEITQLIATLGKLLARLDSPEPQPEA